MEDEHHDKIRVVNNRIQIYQNELHPKQHGHSLKYDKISRKMTMQ